MPKVVLNARLIVSLTLVCSATAAPLLASPNAPLGTVVLSQHALVGSVPVSSGTSLYDGDSVSTDGNGSLQLRIGASQISLSGNSTFSLHRTERGVIAELDSGTMRFSRAAASSLEVRVLGALIRGAQGSSAGQITVVGPNEFQIGATSGSLSVDVDGDVRTVAEGTAYDVTLDSPDSQGPVPTAHRRRILYFVIIPLVAAATIIPVWRAMMSPSKMH